MYRNILLLILLLAPISPSVISAGKHQETQAYVKSPYVEDDVWEVLQPYLLPVDHPAKAPLDKIFGKKRAHESQKEMQKAGFLFRMMGKKRIIVAKHLELWGYIIKTYLDTDDVYNLDWHVWKKRVDGAAYIKECIQQHGYNHLMKVPRKWLYPIPPLPTKGPYRQNFLLVAEDMNILTKSRNRKVYHDEISKEQIDALYTVITECLLIDSIYIPNIPFCHDGKIAFVDTEHFNTTMKPINYYKLSKALSPQMKQYWESLYN